MENKFIWIDYTNHDGVRRIRRIFPLRLVWGCTQWHPKEQWFMEATDIDAGHKIKMFALHSIHASAQTKEELENRK